MKIAVAGYDLEGRVNYSYFRQQYPSAEFSIVDERERIDNLPPDATAILGEGVFLELSDFDLVLRTPGLRPSKIVTSGKIWSATNEFFDKCPAKIIGVTGTKGKGTTCSLIASILRAAGRKVHLVGNIGLPALEVLSDIQPDDIVVYELSSFQLQDIVKSPQIAVVLMIEPDHLDVHSDMDEYLQAKSQIAAHQQSDNTIIYHPTNQLSQQITEKSLGRKQRYASADDGGGYVRASKFFIGDRAICSVDALHLVGRHNQENAAAAITAVYAVDSGISNEAIAEGLAAFDGLPHRLKLVAEKSGVSYYDDSIATTPGSVIAAINSFKSPKVLILGGAEKGADYTEMIQSIADRQNSVQSVLLIGSNAEHLAELLPENQPDLSVHILGKRSMSEIVQLAAMYANPGDVVLLSPAASSFDMFKNYQDRGNQFAEAVKLLN